MCYIHKNLLLILISFYLEIVPSRQKHVEPSKVPYSCSISLDFQLLLSWLRRANVTPFTPLLANQVKAECLM
jgi:hypothetical protein